MSYRSHDEALRQRRAVILGQLRDVEGELSNHEALATHRRLLACELRYIERCLGAHPQRRRCRWGTAVLTLVLSLLALGWVWSALVPLILHPDRLASQVTREARLIRHLATAHVALAAEPGCPSVRDLVDAYELDGELLRNQDCDPWGNPYFVICAEDDIGVLSLGPDQQLGTRDDIVVGAAGWDG